MTENDRNLVKHINVQIQEGEQAQNRIKFEKSTPKYIIIKFLKTKRKVKY